MTRACTYLLVFLTGQGMALAAEQPPKVTATLAASVTAVGPGQPFDLAVTLAVSEGAHVYWENPGDSGLPPSVVWSLPPGFTAGPLRFPVPTVQKDKDGSVTNQLAGSPVLLCTIQPPANLPTGSEVTIGAHVRWLVCKEACYIGEQKLQVKLPAAEQAKPAEGEAAELFDRARRALPLPEGKAKYVNVQAAASKETIDRGDEFAVGLDVKVQPGFHVQSDKPLSEFFIPTRVLMKRAEGLQFGEPVWPEAKVRTDPTIGRIKEFAGSFAVRLPASVKGPTVGESVAIAGLLTYQACEERSGRCFPPETVEWSATVKSAFVKTAEAQAEMAGGSAGEMQPSSAAPTEAGGESTAHRAVAHGDSTAHGAVAHEGWLARLGLLGAVIGGFIGGLILNIMPCVLPVISIKILSFVQQADERPKRVFQLGLTFAAGIVISFWILAAGILLLKHFTGQNRGWGAFFQEPAFVVGMITVVFVFALNLQGVFEIMLPGAAAGRLAGAAEREGFPGAFMKGVLATLLATPCTAPFLFSAISFALAGSAATSFLIFTSAGAGMASPYVLLTARPAWMRYLPRPGQWMVTFKQVMGFVLLGTAVWLLVILGDLMGASGVVWTTGFLTFVGLACWLYGKVEFGWSGGGKAAAYLAVIAIAVFGGWFSYGVMYRPEVKSAFGAGDPTEEALAGLDWSKGVPWVPYRKGLAERLAERGHTVYVDYTATWCPTCQANKALVFSSEDVKRRMKEAGVVPIKADFTAFDADIAADLKRFQRDAVPLNVIYPASRPNDPIVLPVVLTSGLVLEKLNEAQAAAGGKGSQAAER